MRNHWGWWLVGSVVLLAWQATQVGLYLRQAVALQRVQQELRAVEQALAPPAPQDPWPPQLGVLFEGLDVLIPLPPDMPALETRLLCYPATGRSLIPLWPTAPGTPDPAGPVRFWLRPLVNDGYCLVYGPRGLYGRFDLGAPSDLRGAEGARIP